MLRREFIQSGIAGAASVFGIKPDPKLRDFGFSPSFRTDFCELFTQVEWMLTEEINQSIPIDGRDLPRYLSKRAQSDSVESKWEIGKNWNGTSYYPHNNFTEVLHDLDKPLWPEGWSPITRIGPNRDSVQFWKHLDAIVGHPDIIQHWCSMTHKVWRVFLEKIRFYAAEDLGNVLLGIPSPERLGVTDGSRFVIYGPISSVALDFKG